MKINIKNLGVGALTACLLAACDLNTNPTTSVNNNDMYKNTKNAAQVLKGAWHNFFTDGNTYASIGIGALMLNDDFAASDAVRTVSYGFSPSYHLTFGYARGEYNTVMWNLTYDLINNANAVIKHIDDAEGNEKDKSLIKGQALATRGYAYMLLATHYSFAIDVDPDAVCVPIRTEPVEDEAAALEGIPAASVSDVFDRAFKDLGEALTLIPTDYQHGRGDNTEYQIDYPVTLGLLARTNLYARHWDDAYKYAKQAIAINPYLMSEAEYKSGFNDCANKEWMWGLASTLDDKSAAYIFYFKDCASDGYTNLTVDPNFQAMYSDDDYRKDLFYWGRTAYGDPAMLNDKFHFSDLDNEMGAIDLMRTSEMYLILAEAAAHTNKEAEARQTLEKLQNARMKAGHTAPAVTVTGDALIEQIWMERRKELWGEGFALTDLIRNQQEVVRRPYSDKILIDGEDTETEVEGHTIIQAPDGTPFTPNSKYYLFRIPEKEELHNPSLYSEHPRQPFYDL
ncbi:MAG: RagB/SusD family nutrient uptake outer membrane protein [Mediterranea sp.]|jgi:hypothetical protein|nr:RagB/SusD family nutrient uptake outer membrane protein [Mediterranea sp.]